MAKNENNAQAKASELTHLLACPFCGEYPFMYDNPTQFNKWKIACPNDCVTMPARFDMWFTSKEQAIKRWNKRSC